MTNLIPQGWYGVICTGLLVGSIVFIIILCILAIQDARERQIKKLIDYAVMKLAQKGELPAYTYKIASIPETISDMENKLHNLGDKLQGKTIMGKPIRNKSGKFSKEKN